MKASLPLEKLTCICEIMTGALDVATMMKRELLSLLKHFNFAMRTIPQGRSFVSRLLDLSKTENNLHNHITLDEGCRSDLCF